LLGCSKELDFKCKSWSIH